MDNQKWLRNKSEGLENINFRPLLVCLMRKKVNIYLLWFGVNDIPQCVY